MPNNNTMIRTVLGGIAGCAAFAGMAGAAYAMQVSAFDAATAAGEVGEKMDGYIGIVGAETEELRKVVSDINIKRRAYYAEKAQAANATIEEYAFTAGCVQISRTEIGEMYQAYSTGGWKKRTAEAPDRDPRCP